MGEHTTWFDFLYRFGWYTDLSGNLRESLGRGWQWLLFQETHWTVTHIMVALVVMMWIAFGAFRFRSAVVGGGQGALVPPRKLNVRNIFELLCDVTFGMVVGVMGEKNAKKFFPLLASLALFILFSNLMALVPGFAPATDTLKTNLGLALLVFVLTHYYGIKEHGLAYLKHFTGPLWWLAPLMLPIEIIGHLARPVSLALRLMGNMAADHKVLFSFTFLVPFLVPVPFYILGILVCVVQALVFTLLATVYLGMAVSHDH
jgi:F-type H+-transporting ATPase subunit a